MIKDNCKTENKHDDDGVAYIDYTGTETTTHDLLKERGKRYGEFSSHSEISQALKAVMQSMDGWKHLKPYQREALEMIQHKIARVLNGDPMYDDNWKDICGYSQLVVDKLKSYGQNG